MFNIDFTKLVNNLLPWFLRGPRLSAWLMSLTAPAISLHTAFVAFRSSTIFSVGTTGMVLSLESMLNTVFNADALYPRIYISDAERKDKLYFFNAAEGRTTRLHNQGESFPRLYLTNVYEPSGFDFTVWVPAALSFDYSRMYSLVAKHKAAGFQFQIKTF